MYTGMSQHRVQPAAATGRRAACGLWSCGPPTPAGLSSVPCGPGGTAQSGHPPLVLLAGLLSPSRRECVCLRAFSSLSQLFLNVCVFVLP